MHVCMHVDLCVHVSVCVCVYLCLCVQACMHTLPSELVLVDRTEIILCIYFSLNWKLPALARLGGLQALGSISQSSLHNARLQTPAALADTLHGCWGFELRPSWLQSKDYYPLSQLPSPSLAP